MNRKKILWIVTEVFHPEETSLAYIITHVADILNSHRQVKIICGPASYQKSNIKTTRQLNSQIEVNRIKIINLDKNKLFLRTIRIILLTFLLSIKFFFKVKKGDEVLIVTNPSLLVISISWIARVKKLKLNIMAHDIFPENLIAGNLSKPTSITYKLLLKLFNKAYSKADNLIVLGRDMQKVIEAKLASFKKKPQIFIIENWADVDEINYSLKETNKIINDLKLKDKIIFQFSGNLGRLQGLMELLDIIHKTNNSILHFIFIGEGALKKDMYSFLLGNKMANVTMLPSFPRIDQQFFLNATDIGIVSLNANMYGLGVPSKVYNILAAGKPILYIGPVDSEIWLMIKEYNIGWCFEPKDTDGILRFFKGISENDQRNFLEKGTQARKIAEQYYSKSVILQKYVNLFEK